MDYLKENDYILVKDGDVADMDSETRTFKKLYKDGFKLTKDGEFIDLWEFNKVMNRDLNLKETKKQFELKVQDLQVQIDEIDESISNTKSEKRRLKLIKEKIDIANEMDMSKEDIFSETIECEKDFENLKTGGFFDDFFKQSNITKRITNSKKITKPKYALIHSNPQVGKTDATIEAIKQANREGISVILSTPNVTNQANQMCIRLREKSYGGGHIIIRSGERKQKGSKYEKGDKKLIECLITGELFVYVLLDNGPRINKMKKIFEEYGCDKLDKKICLIHDEADLIVKKEEVLTKKGKSVLSHDSWTDFVDFLSLNIDNFSRVFVTATPEITLLTDFDIKISNIRQLKTPDNYTGWQNIEYKVHKKMTSGVIEDAINTEIANLKELGENGQILICVESLKLEHKELLDEFRDLEDCIVHTYNGEGVTTMVPSKNFKNDLLEFAKENNLKWSYEGEYIQIDIDIADYYQICDDNGHGIKLTIGKYMMARCITYTSRKRSAKASVAVALIYKAGSSIGCTSICQATGRLFGTARPDIKRRLYCTKEVEDNFKGYMSMQEEYFTAFEQSKLIDKDILAKDIINGIKYEKPVKRNIERGYFREINKNLKSLLKGRPLTPPPENENIVYQLVDRWWNKKTIIGKILNFVYDSENGVGEEDLKNFISECGSENPEQMFAHLTTNGKEYKHIFKRKTKTNITNIRNEAKEYIMTNK